MKSQLLDALSPPPARNKVEGVDPRRVFKIETTNRLSDAAETMRKRGLRVLGETEAAVYFVAPRPATADQFVSDAERYAEGPDEQDGKGVGRTFFDNVEEIHPYGPTDRRRPGVPAPESVKDATALVVDVCAWPSASGEEARNRLADIRRAVGDGTMLGYDDDPRTTVVRARLDAGGLARVLELFVVESVRLPLGPELEPSDWLTSEIRTFDPPEPLQTVVGVIDDGVIDHPLLVDAIVNQRSFPADYDFGVVGSHGTAVAGLAAYGGFEAFFLYGEVPVPVSVAVARVLQEEEIAGSPVTRLPSNHPDHSVIRQAAEWLVNTCGARVINLSITDPWPFEGPHVGPLTETIDRLSRELDVVFVVSSGNAPIGYAGLTPSGDHVYDDYPAFMFSPEHRLAEPSVAASALTVGAISAVDAGASPDGTTRVDEHAIARAGELSPFSRTGPGIRNAVKPELVADGGTMIWSSGGLKNVDLGASVVTLNANPTQRGFRATRGTSFAAPRVANTVARVADRYPDRSANFLRMITALAASPRSIELDEEQRLGGSGYGEPNLDRALESGPSRVLMSYDGTILTDSANVHAVPVPIQFSSARTRRRMRIAVSFDPPVRRERRDYLGGHLTLNLYRGTSLEDVVAVHQEQIDPKDPTPLPKDRRRFLDKFSPNKTRLLTSSLQVHTWDLPSARSLNAADGELYYLVITHVSAPWAELLGESYETQAYAVAVELEDLESVEVDLRTAVRQRIDVERTRVRL